MNNKDFITEISRRTGIAEKDCSKLLEALAISMGEALYAGNSINLPGLGTFSTELNEEEITTDPSTGKRILMPPYLRINFKEAPSLTLKIKESK